MNANDMNTETAANDLTQLSSREQLSALMDGALPPDQTRFLLRRLQHDAPLAQCWARWRVTGEVMRGLAPARPLPADFATRVSAALQGDGAVPLAAPRRTSGWLRWGGGAAMAASLAVVALMGRQSVQDAPGAASAALASVPATPAAAPAVPVQAGEPAQVLAAAGAIAAAGTSRPARERRAGTPAAQAERAPSAAASVASAPEPSDGLLAAGITVPQPDIVTRPWPRSVLPQYASHGLAVGLGVAAGAAPAYNPFLPQPELGASATSTQPRERAGDERSGDAAARDAASAAPQPEPGS